MSGMGHRARRDREEIKSEEKPALNSLPHRYWKFGLLALLVCFTCWQIMRVFRVFREWQNRYLVILCQIKNETARWGVIPIAQSEHVGNLVSKFVTVFVPAKDKQSWFYLWKDSQVFLRNTAQGRGKYRIPCNRGQFWSWATSNAPIFFALYPWLHWLPLMRVSDTGHTSASLCSEASYCAPREFGRNATTVLKKDHYFSVLPLVLRNNESSNYPILPAYRHVSTLRRNELLTGQVQLLRVNTPLEQGDYSQYNCEYRYYDGAISSGPFTEPLFPQWMCVGGRFAIGCVGLFFLLYVSLFTLSDHRRMGDTLYVAAGPLLSLLSLSLIHEAY